MRAGAGVASPSALSCLFEVPGSGLSLRTPSASEYSPVHTLLELPGPDLPRFLHELVHIFPPI